MKRMSRVAAAATLAVAMSLGVSAGPVFAAQTEAPASTAPAADSPPPATPETPTTKPSPTSVKPSETEVKDPPPSASSTTPVPTTSASAPPAADRGVRTLTPHTWDGFTGRYLVLAQLGLRLPRRGGDRGP
ncbi:hypothetical protein [Amycolatopsis tolypomycina]|uniref:hypothetical protein n=1 Tax=Amycolatopsis tolypomycina TaxID=208445 RepID=UPI00339E46FC